jgi:predicted alpha/beta superfamily hydrolase
MLIVGIGYPTERAFDADRRAYDYTPAAPPDGPAQTHYRRLSCAMGGANRFLAFIEDDLKPLIEGEFPVDRRRQALFGHSFGGLFVLHVLFTRTAAFQTYVAASPSITWGEPAIDREERLFAEGGCDGPVRLLVTVGEYEAKLTPYERSAKKAAEREAYLREFRMIDRARALVERLNALQRPRLVAEFKEYPGEGHMSLVPTAMSHSLRFTSAM